jgi:hypothetical protein
MRVGRVTRFEITRSDLEFPNQPSAAFNPPFNSIGQPQDRLIVPFCHVIAPPAGIKSWWAGIAQPFHDITLAWLALETTFRHLTSPPLGVTRPPPDIEKAFPQ